MISQWPTFNPALDFPKEEAAMAKIIAAIRAIRNRRAEMNVPPSKKASLLIVTSDNDAFNDSTKTFFEKLAYSSAVTIADQGELANAVQIVSDSCTLYIPLSDVVDTEKELARLTKEKERLLGEIDRIDRKLSNPGFVAKAPAAVIDGEKEKLAKYQEMLQATEAALLSL